VHSLGSFIIRRTIGDVESTGGLILKIRWVDSGWGCVQASPFLDRKVLSVDVSRERSGKPEPTRVLLTVLMAALLSS
jgi:hypothetical protein